MYPFERFTDAAKVTLTIAQREAEEAFTSNVGTEHLLIALLSQRDTVAGTTLARIGVREDDVRSRITAILGANERVVIQHLIPTSRVKTVVEKSFEAALHAGSAAVATDHLLLGLLGVGDSIAARVLVDAGATAEVVRTVSAEVRESGVSEPSSSQHLPESSRRPDARLSREWIANAIAGSKDEATADLDDEVTDVHLLRHVLQSKDPRVVAALERQGADVDALLAALRPPERVIELRRAVRDAARQASVAEDVGDDAGAEVARLHEAELRRELAEAEAAWDDQAAP